MSSWPVSLPAPIISTLQETPPDGLIRTAMDKGVAKVRRRTSANPRNLQFQLTLTPAQVDTLDTFFITTTNGGADEFTYTHPRTSATHTARFTAAPEYTHLTHNAYRATVALELLP